MKKYWWKILAILLVLYSISGGLIIDVPALPVLNETIRNLYFHVPMWWSMIIILLVSMVASIMYLGKFNLKYDAIAHATAQVGMLTGLLGLLTGMLWAKFTWGSWWVADARLNGAAITMLIYLAYFVLRGALEEEHQRARVAGVYSIFAYVMLVVFLTVIPRLSPDSLHPGYGGNPAFSQYDLDDTMRMVFYPSVIGWITLSVWLANLRIRLFKIERKIIYQDDWNEDSTVL